MPPDSTASTPGHGDPATSVGAAALSPAERSRLAQCFARGTQSAPTDLDYAIEMFSFCVAGDPSNAVYLQGFLGVLKRKHAGKKGLGLSSLFSTARGSLKKLAAAAQWREVIRHGVDILKAHPSDHATLLAMAEACGNLMYLDAQSVYLRAALDAAPADPEVNRQCARFAANQGQFNQAIECWRRISNQKGLREEADREIARLSVEKTIVAGQGMVGRPVAGAGAGTKKPDAAAPTAGSRTAELREEIRRNPANLEAYYELADLLERDATVEEAEKVLAQALAVSGNELKVQEHVEDRQLRWARHKLLLAEKRLEAGETPEGRALVERLKAAQIRQEIEVYAARCARYPENVIWKYELAMRLKAAGNYGEAIKHFQEVLQDHRRKGSVSLELGECFQKIKQYQLAMRSYQTAVESLTDRELELRKRALYRAGVLATGLDDPDSARKYLAMLAALDFNYRDVAQRLDKLGAAKDNSASEPAG